jgi:hypothetical protein
VKVYVWARWERLRRPSARLLAFDPAFQDLLAALISLITGYGFGPGVLDAEGVGDPLVRGVSLPVDAVRVDLQQDGAGTSGGMRRTGTVGEDRRDGDR